MENSERVSADPYPNGISAENVNTAVCFACNRHPIRQTCQLLKMISKQVIELAQVDTGDANNPFSGLPKNCIANVHLCTPCRSRTTVWYAIIKPKKFGRINVQRFIKAWKSRKVRKVKQSESKPCYVCSENAAIIAEINGRKEASIERKPTRDLRLFNFALSSAVVKERFIIEFCRLSSAERVVANRLLQFPAEFCLCQMHINHSRYAQQVAFKFEDGFKGRAGGCCVFMDAGHTASGSRPSIAEICRARFRCNGTAFSVLRSCVAAF